MTPEQEHQLLQDLKNKHVSAFKILVVENWDDLLITATIEVGNPSEADDIVSKFLIDQYNTGFEGVMLPIRKSLFKLLGECLKEIEQLS